jgi:phosphatidylserine/phosphatidylglycerophosphate/cardiolipin synthase-like enzyme
MRSWFIACLCALVVSPASATSLFDSVLARVRNAAASAESIPAGQASIEVGFSPEGSAQELVIKAIRSANASIRLAAYSFTSSAVVRALIDAKRRGVDVAVLVDHKNNLVEERSGKGRAALNLLFHAGIPTRTISTYQVHHSKFMVIDGLHTETGSFNYSQAADQRNSENVLVIWNNKAVAAQYLTHWQSRWVQGVAYQPPY